MSAVLARKSIFYWIRIHTDFSFFRYATFSQLPRFAHILYHPTTTHCIRIPKILRFMLLNYDLFTSILSVIHTEIIRNR